MLRNGITPDGGLHRVSINRAIRKAIHSAEDFEKFYLFRGRENLWGVQIAAKDGMPNSKKVYEDLAVRYERRSKRRGGDPAGV